MTISVLAITWLVALWFSLSAHADVTSDAHGYWLAAQEGVNPYGRAWGLQPDAYVYPPPFLQLITPFARLAGWPTFHAIWTAALMLGVVWLVGPAWAVVLLAPIRGWPVWESLIWGNVEIPMTIAMLLALRWSGAWAGLFLTKVTPGLAILWHAARGEWSAFRGGLLATLAVALASFAIAPGLWLEWGHLLSTTTYIQPFAAPLWARVALGASVVLVGGALGQRWTIAAAVVVSHPAIWFNTLAIPILWVAAVTRREGPQAVRLLRRLPGPGKDQ